jgi:hypothetical protein
MLVLVREQHSKDCCVKKLRLAQIGILSLANMKKMMLYNKYLGRAIQYNQHVVVGTATNYLNKLGKSKGY